MHIADTYDLVYKCPNCGQLISVETYWTCLTYFFWEDIKEYSDSKKIQSLLKDNKDVPLDLPEITVCSKCNKIFWIKNLKEIGTIQSGQTEDAKKGFHNVNKARFLTIAEYFLALQLPDVNHSTEDENFIRQQIWQTFNDRIRERKTLYVEDSQLFENAMEQKQWEENCRALIKLYEKDCSEDGKRLRAELYRNLGEFEECIKILETLPDNIRRDILMYLAKIKNSLVVKFDLRCCTTPYFYTRGILKMADCNYDGAMSDFQKTLIVDANFADVYLSRALCNRRNKNYEAAREDFDKFFALLKEGNTFRTMFNEEDIFKYGRLLKPYNAQFVIEIHLDANTKTGKSTFLTVDATQIPFFFFASPLYNTWLVKCCFAVAKALFYFSTYVLGRKIRYVSGLNDEKLILK
jgi:tetratricopeptide (TPR) repeat protein